MRKRRLQSSVVLAGIALALAVAFPGAAARVHAAAEAVGPVVPIVKPRQFTLALAGGRTVVVEKAAEGRWASREAGDSYLLAADGGGFRFEKNGALVATGKLADGKLKWKAPGGAVLLKIKLKEDKLKVFPSDDENAAGIELKPREDKYKVLRGEVEIGKVKYYPEKRALKVKDAGEKEVGAVAAVDGLFAGPAAFLVAEFDASRQHLLMLSLLALGK
jgi:hypothetical protein